MKPPIVHLSIFVLQKKLLVMKTTEKKLKDFDAWMNLFCEFWILLGKSAGLHTESRV